MPIQMTQDELDETCAEVRREALEEAAKACEASPYPDGDDCARIVRSFIDQPSEPRG